MKFFLLKTVKYFHVFGSKCYILADCEQRRKMDPKSDEEIFLGYSTNIVVNDSLVENDADVEDDVGTSSQQSDAPEDVPDIESNIESDSSEVQINKGTSIRIQKDPPKDLILRNLNEGITTRSKDVISNSCFISKF